MMMSFIHLVNKSIIFKTAFCGLFFLLSCTSNEKRENIVAKVYDTVLLTSEISHLDGEERDEYVQEWISSQVYLNAFKELDLPDEKIKKRVFEYENSLKTYKVEEVLVKEKVDTVVSENEIIQFYNSHKADFELKDFLVQVMYLKVPSEAPDLDKVEQWYLLKNPKDTALMQDYAKLYAVNFYHDKESWVFFDDILKEVPLQDFDKERFIVRKSKVDFEENGFTYFLNIYDYRLKDALSPLEFERENIKQRIINHRVKELRGKIEKELLDKAYANNKVIINL